MAMIKPAQDDVLFWGMKVPDVSSHIKEQTFPDPVYSD